MKESILKICKTLRETGVKQMRGMLYDRSSGKKCALGVLSCEYYKDLTKKHIPPYDYLLILDACGVPKEYLECVYPSYFVKIHSNQPYLLVNQQYLDLSDIITYLNDVERLTFKQIADYLETTFIPEPTRVSGDVKKSLFRGWFK